MVRQPPRRSVHENSAPLIGRPFDDRGHRTAMPIARGRPPRAPNSRPSWRSLHGGSVFLLVRPLFLDLFSPRTDGRAEWGRGPIFCRFVLLSGTSFCFVVTVPPESCPNNFAGPRPRKAPRPRPSSLNILSTKPLVLPSCTIFQHVPSIVGARPAIGRPSLSALPKVP